MDEPQDSRSAGDLVAGPEGARAFELAPLPPSFQWTHALVRALSDADRAIGQLASEGRRLPNPHLLIAPIPSAR